MDWLEGGWKMAKVWLSGTTVAVLQALLCAWPISEGWWWTTVLGAILAPTLFIVAICQIGKIDKLCRVTRIDYDGNGRATAGVAIVGGCIAAAVMGAMSLAANRESWLGLVGEVLIWILLVLGLTLLIVMFGLNIGRITRENGASEPWWLIALASMPFFIGTVLGGVCWLHWWSFLSPLTEAVERGEKEELE